MTKDYLPAKIDELGGFARIATASGLFGGNVNEAIVKLMAGASWGIPPMSALADVYVVKGKPMASATLLRALVRRSGRYDYRILENTSEAAEIAFFEVRVDKREEIGRTRFTIEDAKRAGLTRNETYTKFGRAMLLSRCTSEGVKAHCPDVFTGSIYYAEEWGNELEDAGPIEVESRVVSSDSGQQERQEVPQVEREIEVAEQRALEWVAQLSGAAKKRGKERVLQILELEDRDQVLGELRLFSKQVAEAMDKAMKAKRAEVPSDGWEPEPAQAGGAA